LPPRDPALAWGLAIPSRTEPHPSESVRGGEFAGGSQDGGSRSDTTWVLLEANRSWVSGCGWPPHAMMNNVTAADSLARLRDALMCPPLHGTTHRERPVLYMDLPPFRQSGEGRVSATSRFRGAALRAGSSGSSG
jgi:hypothetical protein